MFRLITIYSVKWTRLALALSVSRVRMRVNVNSPVRFEVVGGREFGSEKKWSETKHASRTVHGLR